MTNLEARDIPAGQDIPIAGILKSGGVHKQTIRIYFEDTDASGIVYYANYLRFIERGRTDFMRLLGISHSRFARDEGIYFVVRRCNIKYLLPARLDELIEVRTSLINVRESILDLDQRIVREMDTLAIAQIRVASVDGRGKVQNLPEAAYALLKTMMPKPIVKNF